MQVAFDRGVDLVAPGARLRVQIVEVGKAAPCEEVIFDIIERALDARRPIGVSDGMRDEFKAESFAEGGHLRHRHHLLAAAGEHHQMRIVDHAPGASPLEVLQSFGQKDLALESAEVRIALEKQHMRETERERCRLHGRVIDDNYFCRSTTTKSAG